MRSDWIHEYNLRWLQRHPVAFNGKIYSNYLLFTLITVCLARSFNMSFKISFYSSCASIKNGIQLGIICLKFIKCKKCKTEVYVYLLIEIFHYSPLIYINIMHTLSFKMQIFNIIQLCIKIKQKRQTVT